MEPEELDGLTYDDIAAFDPPIKNDWINAMYARVGVDRARLKDALREMGPPPQIPDGWTPDNPTKNYCAVVTVFLHRILRERGIECRKMKIQSANHYYIRLVDGGVIIDLTAEQVDYPIPYCEGRPAPGVGNRRRGVRTYAEDLRKRIMPH